MQHLWVSALCEKDVCVVAGSEMAKPVYVFVCVTIRCDVYSFHSADCL